MKRIVQIAVAISTLLWSSAGAAVTDVASNGFTIKLEQVIAAQPDKVYATLVNPASWWSSQHTWSGSAANLSFDARAGGCFCEKLPQGGSTQHLAVVRIVPGKSLVLTGLLGPFQSIAGSGVMTWTLKAEGNSTHVTLTYQIAGYANMTMNDKGYEFWANAANEMLTGQLSRLKAVSQTGKAE